jgi:hypothetical protein
MNEHDKGNETCSSVQQKQNELCHMPTEDEGLVSASIHYSYTCRDTRLRSPIHATANSELAYTEVGGSQH